MSREPPMPVTPYSLATWSWQATAPRWVCPAVCPEGQGSLRSAKGQGEGLFFSQERVLSSSPRSQQKQPQHTGPSFAVPPMWRLPRVQCYGHTCELLWPRLYVLSVAQEASQPSSVPADPAADPFGSLLLRSHFPAGGAPSWLLPRGIPPCPHITPPRWLPACRHTVTTRGVHPLCPPSPDPQKPAASRHPRSLNSELLHGSLLPLQRTRGEGYRKILFNWSSTSLPGNRGRPALASSGRKRRGRGADTREESLILVTPHPPGPCSLPPRGPSQPYLSAQMGGKVLRRPPACHLQRCSRLTTCQWTWSTAWPQRGHPVGGTTV